jgi:hypothetical protein
VGQAKDIDGFEDVNGKTRDENPGHDVLTRKGVEGRRIPSIEGIMESLKC